jgi:GrpB-like predicted nucleotidyltransferase (UPF0157 family)
MCQRKVELAMRIEIMQPQSTWADAYLALRDALMPLAPPGASINHIGSTAVRGLVAKDVIDIQLTVVDLAQVDCASVERCGFTWRSGLKSDHAPPGLMLPAPELGKLFFKSTGRPANLHIRERGRFNQRYALLCRDFLRAHPVAAAAYGQIKQQLAMRFPEDQDAYYDIKDPVCDIIMDGANDWARLAGWTEPPGD